MERKKPCVTGGRGYLRYSFKGEIKIQTLLYNVAAVSPKIET
jgi:hypothetical protein